MSKLLSIEQIEEWRRYMVSEYAPCEARPGGPDEQDIINIAEINTLCDMALRTLSQPPDSEAERLLTRAHDMLGLCSNSPHFEDRHEGRELMKDISAHLSRQPAAQKERRSGERRMPERSRSKWLTSHENRKADRRQPAAREPERQLATHLARQPAARHMREAWIYYWMKVGPMDRESAERCVGQCIEDFRPRSPTEGEPK